MRQADELTNLAPIKIYFSSAKYRLVCGGRKLQRIFGRLTSAEDVYPHIDLIERFPQTINLLYFILMGTSAVEAS